MPGLSPLGPRDPSVLLSPDERRKRNRTFIDPVTEVPRLEQWSVSIIIYSGLEPEKKIVLYFCNNRSFAISAER